MSEKTPDLPALEQTTLPLQGQEVWGYWLVLGLVAALSITISAYATWFALGLNPTAIPDALRISTKPVSVYSGIFRTLLFYSFSAFLFWRRPRDRMVILTSLMFVSMGGVSSCNILLTSPWSLTPTIPVWRTFAALSLLTATFSIYLMPLLFPSGRFVPSWSRFALVLIYPVPIVHVALFWWTSKLNVGILLTTLFLLCLSQLFLIYRYYLSTDYREKQQLKWVGLGIAWAIILQAGFATQLNPYKGPFHWGKYIGFYAAITLSNVSILVGYVLPLLRYQLWETDIAINRSLVYGGLFFGLLALFAGGFWGLQGSFTWLFGNEQKAISAAAAMGIVALAFQPTLRWLRRTVDQKIFGIAIDYRQFAQQETETPFLRTEHALPPTPSQATMFGDYIKQEQLGVGGMGEVYLASHQSTGERVAIKRLLPERNNKPEIKERFLREAEILEALHHPHIIQVLDYEANDDGLFMVMEYIEGADLDELNDPNTPFTLDAILPFLRNVAEALDYAHLQGVVHRDVKPANVMLAATKGANLSNTAGEDPPADNRLAGFQRAVLMDFGIARYDAGTQLTLDNKFLGTPQYIAPEQINGASQVDGRADIYAMGVMTYLLLTGHLPFVQDQLFSLMMAHLSQPPPDPRRYIENMPTHTAQALLKALRKQPNARFDTTLAFVEALHTAN